MKINTLIVAAVISMSVALTGCVSSGGSSFGGSSAQLSVKAEAADKDAKAARRDLRALKKQMAKQERSVRRNERTLKRLQKRKRTSKKTRNRIASLESKITASQKNLKLLKKEEKKAKRVADRSTRKAERLEVRVASARRAEANRARRKAQRDAARASRPQVASAGGFTSLFSRGNSYAFARDYRARTDGGFRLPAIPIQRMNKRYLRQIVNYPTRERPGTLIVDARNKFLYLIQPGGKAMRYGVGVGKAGFEWQGTATVAWKREWPKWTPPAEMIQRRPELARYGGENGMKPGLENPLGARALYIHQNGRDTLYRLHGSPEWNSIGTAASSGCIRLINQDVIDLYSRVRNGAKIVVKQ